jgi:arsenical pump membrane protein
MTPWIVAAVVIATLALMLARPRGVSEAWVALGGALALLATGAVDPAALPGIAGETADVLLFLLGMMTLTGIVERAGIFDLLAEGCARSARGSGRRLYVLLFLLGAVVTALLSLDVTVIVLTPIVYAVTRRRALDPLPFMFATAFVANTASLALPVSNLTNLLLYDALGLSFARFAATMWLPNLVAALTNLAVFLWLFRDRIPRRIARSPVETGDVPALRVATRRWRIAAGIALVATLAALLACGLVERPLWWASVAGGGLLLLAAALAGRVTVAQAIGDVSWSLGVFVIAMTVLVRAVETTWLAEFRPELPGATWASIGAGVAAGALGSNVINNVPMTILARSVLETLPAAERATAAWAVLVGVNIGPALTTYGSLATMLWLTLIRRNGLDVTTAGYLRVSLVTVPIVLLTTSLALWLALAT